jgi:hypothetical protein
VLPNLGTAPAGAPEITLTWRQASALSDVRESDEQRAVIAYRRGGSMIVTREPAAVWFGVPEPVPGAAIIHPMSTLPLSVFSRWAGRMTLHGGAFVHDGGAWGICGEQTAGKSSALALLGSRGVPILSDDLIVVDGRDVLAGPRCVDLRPDVAAHFPTAEPLGVIGRRERYRLPTVEAPPRAPLRGIFLLDWAAGEPSVTPLGMQERLKLLYGQQYTTVFQKPDERIVVELLDVPMYRFARPRDWDAAENSTDALLAATTG